jgi:preprotein translocase subunit SecG
MFGDYRLARKRGILLLQQWIPAMRIIQIVLSIAVVVFILLQARGAGLGSAFGGSSAGSVFKTRRGVERLIFNATIVFIVLFALISVLSAMVTARGW